MNIRLRLAILSGKASLKTLKLLKIGQGTALPGLIALKIYPQLLSHFTSQFRLGTIIVSGTNGKTTTTSLLSSILQTGGYKTLQNQSGSNLERGLISQLLNRSTLKGKIYIDIGVFEIDEAVLPKVVTKVKPMMIIATNLFRDQLDRYGELDSIASNWRRSFESLKNTLFILNADDPLIANVKDPSIQTLFYGFNIQGQKQLFHSADSIYCPKCKTQLQYQTVFYSHLGNWHCPHCHYHNPPKMVALSSYNDKQLTLQLQDKPITIETKLKGLYNYYNISAAFLAASLLKVSTNKIVAAISGFKPIFGRQEIIKKYQRNTYLLLSKNPTGFNQSLEVIKEYNPKHMMLILNDRIADGEDVSWIADVDFTSLNFDELTLTLSGTRAYDLALRLKYELPIDKQTLIDKWTIEPNIRKALYQALTYTPRNETLYVLPTYTAMLEIRKILTGQSLL